MFLASMATCAVGKIMTCSASMGCLPFLNKLCLWLCACLAPLFACILSFVCVSIYIYIYIYIYIHIIWSYVCICIPCFSNGYPWLFSVSPCFSLNICFFVILQSERAWLFRPEKHGRHRVPGCRKTIACRPPVECFQVVVLDYILLGVDGFSPVETLPESTQVLQVIRMISNLDFSRCNIDRDQWRSLEDSRFNMFMFPSFILKVEKCSNCCVFCKKRPGTRWHLSFLELD